MSGREQMRKNGFQKFIEFFFYNKYGAFREWTVPLFVMSLSYGLFVLWWSIFWQPETLPSLTQSPVQRWELDLPQRASDARVGHDVFRSLSKSSPRIFQNTLKEEIIKGNIPSFLRQLVPVGIKSGEHVLTIWTMPDYVAVGSDQDYVRAALDLPTAKNLARELNLLLPTRKMVKWIHEKSQMKLKPQSIPPGPDMTSVEYMLRHHDMIEKDLRRDGAPRLIAGHKKDLVITPQLYHKQRGRLAIYGWHRQNGRPIQGLSFAHHESYYDYSHGVRFVARQCIFNGKIRDLKDLLQDPKYAHIVSDEGTFITLPDLSYDVFAEKLWH